MECNAKIINVFGFYKKLIWRLRIFETGIKKALINVLFTCCLAQASKQITSLFSIHIYHKLLGKMLNHMQHFVAETVHIFRFRSNPSDNNHQFTNINVRVGDTLASLNFEHEITGIFERNAAASQIPKMSSYLLASFE